MPTGDAGIKGSGFTGLEPPRSPGGLTEMSPVRRPGRWGWRGPGVWGSPRIALLGLRQGEARGLTAVWESLRPAAAVSPSGPGPLFRALLHCPGPPRLTQHRAVLAASGSPRLKGVKRPGPQKAALAAGGWKRSPVPAFLP